MIAIWKQVSFIALVCLQVSIFAQSSKLNPPCNRSATGQSDLNVCAEADRSQADADLNTVYQSLVKARSSDANAVEKLRLAERSWIAYRNAYLKAAFPATNPMTEYGSSYGMELSKLEILLIRAHIQELQTLQKYPFPN